MKIAAAKQANLSSKQQKILDDQSAVSFGRTYFQLCQLYSLPVLTHLINHEPNTLSLDVDKIHKDEEWSPVLIALKKNRDLSRISIFSEVNERKHMVKEVGNRFDNGGGSVKPVFRILPELMSGVRDGLLFNTHLKILDISGIALREVALKLLAKGILNNTKLQYLSFSRCRIGDSGVFILAPSIRTVKHLRILNLSGCCLTEKGAHIISAFLKSLAVRRQADLWAHSLRISPSDYDTSISCKTPKDAPKPLKRLIMCQNNLGDKGAIPLFDLLYEEVGLGALDLHHNQLTNKSGNKALEVLKVNRDLVVFDLKGNDIDAKILNEMNHYLIINEKARQLMHPGIDNDYMILDEKAYMKPVLFGEQNHTKQTQSSISKMARLNSRSSEKIVHLHNSQLLIHARPKKSKLVLDSKQKFDPKGQAAKKELLERIKLMRKIPKNKSKIRDEADIEIFSPKLKKKDATIIKSKDELRMDSVLNEINEIDKTLDALDLYYKNEDTTEKKIKFENNTGTAKSVSSIPSKIVKSDLQKKKAKGTGRKLDGATKRREAMDLQNENINLKKRLNQLEQLVSTFLDSIPVHTPEGVSDRSRQREFHNEPLLPKQEILAPVTKLENMTSYNLEENILKIQGACKEPKTSVIDLVEMLEISLFGFSQAIDKLEQQKAV